MAGSGGIDDTVADGDRTLDESAIATDKTIASSPPPSASSPPPSAAAASEGGLSKKTISGTEETILPASEPPPSGEVREGNPPSTPPKDAGPTDDYSALVVVDPRHYLLSSEVARGGMGRILRARDRRLGRTIAIKELLVRDDALAARFEREARITARLQHPGIVALHEAGRWPTGEPFFAMKLVSGRPLDKVIAQTKSLRDRLGLLANVIAVVDALAYAHSEGIVHRDLKPANVLVGDYGETVVIDWGLAKDVAADEPELAAGPYRKATPASANSGETLAGSVIGTPAYMPPEQAAGEKVDARADVYALGALLYHLLTGRAPYEAKTVEGMLAKVLGGPPPSMQDIDREIPADLVAIVEKAMAREPDQRFPTAREMVEELKRFQTGQLVTSHHYTAWELFRRWVSRHRGVVAVSALALVVLGVFGAFSVSRIVAARDDAKQKAILAKAAQDAAEQRANQITLEQATSSLDLDPTLSISLLSQVTTKHDPSVLRDMRRIAADAASRGIAHVLRGNGRVNGLGISPDGAWIAAGGVDRKIHLWDVAARTERVLEGHEHPILDVVVTNDEVTSVDDRGTVRRWRLRESTPGTIVRAAGSSRIALAKLAPTGTAVAAFRNGATEIVELASGKVHERGDYQLGAWTPDGKTVLLFADPNKTIDRFELATGAVTTTQIGKLVTAMATDGRRIIIGDEEQRVRDVTSDIMVSEHVRHNGMVTTLALLADGTIVSSSSDYEYTKEHHEVERNFRSGDYSVIIWPFEPHEAVRLRGHQVNIDAVAVTPNGKVVASAGRDGTIRVWSRPVVSRYYGHAQLDTAVLSSDGKYLAVINNGSELDLHEVAAKQKFDTVELDDIEASTDPAPAPAPKDPAPKDPKGPAPKGPAGKGPAPNTTPAADQVETLEEPPRHQLSMISSADDGMHFATLDTDAAAVAWDMTIVRPTGRGRGRLLARSIATLAISPDAKRIITAAKDGTVTEWDGTTLAGKPLAPATKPVTSIAISKAGTIALAYDDGTVELLGGAKQTLQGPADTLKVLAFAPDGKTLVGGGEGRQLRVWNVATGELRSWAGHEDRIAKLVFSPDGSHVASAALDNTARVWRLADGTAAVLRGHAGAINTIAFRADGAALVTSGDDRTARLWDLPKGRHRVLARHGDYVVFAAFLGSARILSVDHQNEMVEVPDDLPTDEAGLRRWLAAATNYTP